jgi:hypothetical protein
MKKINLGQKVGIGVGVIAALAMGSIFPAFADSHDSFRGASAKFRSRGDTFIVNGYGAFVSWIIPSTGRSDRCYESSSPCNYNFRERRIIQWRLCVVSSSGGIPTVDCKNKINTDNTSLP